ncbi:MAG: alpha-D-ribose 1-methylphosphonate 5-triphosphate diphosphatase [Cyclobacteriaceae bacterium]
MNSFVIANAAVITPYEVVENASVVVEHGVITDILSADDEHHVGNVIDATGGYVLPGIIDMHTDALDAEIIPRPGADIPIAVAFRELERKMSGCGFTTVYHSMHLGYESAELNSRSKYSRLEVFETVHRESQSKTLLNNKIHLRFELSGVDSYDTCIDFMNKGYVSLLSIMDHTPGQGQMNRQHFLDIVMSRGKTPEQAEAEYQERINRPIIEGEKLEALVNHAKKLNIVVASHDDDTIDKVNYVNSLGVKICEFPINLETARHATGLGMHVIGGASNILRGGSLSGNLNMKDAVLQGSVNSLCSDYYPPAILHSIFKLYHEESMPLTDAVNLATLNPAKAVGISDHTGSIEKGKYADLLIVKLYDGIPMVTHTIVKGDIVAQSSANVNYREHLSANALEEVNS